MVVDSEWPDQEEILPYVLNEKGYHRVGTEEFVPDDEAFEYA